MIDEKDETMYIPLEFAKRLAERMEDFDRTGLKIKTGEFADGDGPLRQDELSTPIQWFGEDNDCPCTSVSNCVCVEHFLNRTRPPSINDYDGFNIKIKFVDGDPCGVLKDLLPGAKVASAAPRGAAAVGALALLSALLALLVGVA